MSKYYFILLLTFFVQQTCTGQSDPYIDYETAPQLYGGYDSLYKVIKPLTTIKSNCANEGRVFVTFLLSKEAKISEVKVAKGLCPKEDSIAIEIVRSLRYIPAKYKGEPIETMRSIPIYFTKEE
ncbi:MAG: energy transducer TonB [Bacteroidota bacterium]